MIDNKDINAYMSIKAPLSIKEKIMAEQAKKHSNFPSRIQTCYALAAVLLVIVAVFAFLPDTNTELYFGDCVSQSRQEFCVCYLCSRCI